MEKLSRPQIFEYMSKKNSLSQDPVNWFPPGHDFGMVKVLGESDTEADLEMVIADDDEDDGENADVSRKEVMLLAKEMRRGKIQKLRMR